MTRAGWYSYDLLDNLGRPSARRIIPEFQSLSEGDIVPISPDGRHGITVHRIDEPRTVIWGTPGDTTWTWVLKPSADGSTRLITRVRSRYRWLSPTIAFSLLLEFADIWMMRRMLLNLLGRVEDASVKRKGAAEPVPLMRPGNLEHQRTLVRAIQYAVRAPSGHNTQPWRFRLVDGGLQLFCDRSRALGIVDPADRALMISCGAALHHLRIALLSVGFRPHIRTWPDDSDPDLVAEVQLDERYSPEDDERELFDAIRRRRTNRGPFDSREVSPALLGKLASEAETEGAQLRILDQQHRERLVDLVAEGNRAQFADRDFRRELATWIRWNGTRRRDGMPGSAHGAGLLKSIAMPLVLRSLDLGPAQARTDRQLLSQAPVLAVICTATDDRHAWIAAGQALSRVLLRATADGLSASFFNQPVEVPDLRRDLGDLLGGSVHPQLVVRLGYASEVRGTPRRSVSEVLIRD